MVGVTTHRTGVSPRVQSLFLHETNVLAPSQQERAEMLRGVAREVCPSEPLGADVDLTDVAKRSAVSVL